LNWNREIDQLAYEKCMSVLRGAVLTLIVLLALLLLFKPATVTEPPPGYYYLLKSELSNHVKPWQIARFPPAQMRIERVDDFCTNVWGWVGLTNSTGISSTQWFRGTFYKESNRKIYLKEIRRFMKPPPE
jgi:hypothetical protein